MELYRSKITGPVERHITTLKRDQTHPVTGYDPDDFFVSESSKYTLGVNTKDYHLRLARGELLPFTWFRQVEINGEHGIAPYSWDRPAYSTWAIRDPGNSTSKALAESYWRLTIPQLEGGVSWGSAQYHLQSAASKIYSSGWDALTFAAELEKTVQMFRNLVGGLASFLYKLPKGDFPSKLLSGKLTSVDRMTHVPFNKWLELRYGWRTLIYDMQDFARYVVGVNDGRKRFNERVGSTTTSETYLDFTYVHSPGTVNLRQTLSKKVGTRGSIVADIEPPKLAFNPVTTAWELVTLSFVVDWFLDVGQWLEGLSFLAIERQYVAAIGYHEEIKKTVVTTSVVPAAGYTYSWYPYSEWTGSVTWRDPATVPLLPLISVRLNAFKVYDLVALAVQRFIRR